MIRTLLILSFGTSFIATCYGVEIKCYFGSIGNGKSNLQVLQCNARSKNPEIIGNSDTSQNFTAVSHCLVFSQNLKGDVNKATTDFECDYDHVCSNGISVLPKDNGTIHCCNSSLCNSPTSHGLEMPELQCYSGTVTEKNFPKTVSYCNSKFCIAAEYLNPSKSLIPLEGISYQCDDENKCNQHNIRDGCKNVTTESGTLKLCCCTTSHCNKYMSSEPPDTTPMGTLPPTDNSHSNMMYIGGVISATIVAVLVVIVLIIVIRKCQQRKDEHVRYIYSQLTADLSEELDDDDAYMIVA